MNFTDSHAHLDFVDDLDGAIARAKEAGGVKIITVGTTLEESKMVIEIASKYSSAGLNIYATCGIHPKDGRDDVEKLGVDQSIDRLRKIAKSSQKVVAIGECGLDYYLGTSEKEKRFQRELFEAQIKLAIGSDLPLVVHCRNGWDEIFDPISNFQVPNSKLRGVFHSWTGDWVSAKRALDLGFYISFSGIVTFKQSLRFSSFAKLRTAGLENAPDVAEVAQKMPLDRMLIETDSPFLAPEPVRGSKNEPKNVTIVAQFIANLRNLPFDKISEVTGRNAEILFGLDPLV